MQARVGSLFPSGRVRGQGWIPYSMQKLKVEDLRGLELLLSTIELGSISAAARRHFLSQPAATAQLQNLETRLGVPLLERGALGSSPTAAGTALAAWAREITVATERFAAGVEALREGAEPHLRVAASLTIAEYLLPVWLIECRQPRKDWAVDLEVANSVVVADRVASKAVDIGFVESPRHFEDLTSEVIGHDELIVVVGRSHPWTRRSTALTAERLASAPLLLRELGSGTREFFDDALVRKGLPPVQPHGVLGSTSALKAAVAGGTACTVLSELAVAGEIATGRLVRIAVDGIDLKRTLRAVWYGPTPPKAALSLLAVARAYAEAATTS